MEEFTTTEDATDGDSERVICRVYRSPRATPQEPSPVLGAATTSTLDGKPLQESSRPTQLTPLGSSPTLDKGKEMEQVSSAFNEPILEIQDKEKEMGNVSAMKELLERKDKEKEMGAPMNKLLESQDKEKEMGAPMNKLLESKGASGDTAQARKRRFVVAACNMLKDLFC